MKNLIGTMLGNYEIIEKIGQGGMAHVFQAYQPGLDRFVAVKVLPPTLADEAGFTERFQREAQAVARLNHPNILQVYDFGSQDNYNYLVMRYVEASKTLGDLIRLETPVNKLIDYILQVADALNYAHEQGIVHRDVKPGNILIDGKWALLSDFGLVKIQQAASQLTGTGIGMGTPAFMSPEQAAGVDVDHRTDIYALGVILHRILTGAIPHDAPTPLAILVKRQSEPVTPPRQIRPEISESLEQVILRSLAPKPDQRYSTAIAFAEALKQAEADPTYREGSLPTVIGKEDATLVSSKPKILTPPSRPPAKRMGLWAGGAVVAIALIAGFIWLGSMLVANTRLLAAQSTPTPPQTIANTATPTSLPPSPTPSPSLTPLSTPSALAKVDLEVRSGPGNGYDLLGYLPAGATTEIMGQDKTRRWWQIKTTLSATGLGWIKAGADLVTSENTNQIPIALAPATPTPIPNTPTPSSTPTQTTIPATASSTPSPTVTSTPSPTPTATTANKAPVAPAATKVPAPLTGQFTLLKPISLDQPSFGLTEFEWQWGGQLEAGQGFEVRVWQEGEPPAGAHDAVLDNKNGLVQALGNNRYRLVINIKDAFGVKGRSGEYLWTVVLVQISPDYRDLGIQSPPLRLRFEAGGGGGGGKDSGGGGGTSI
jgi:serine/threonine-protein kinase